MNHHSISSYRRFIGLTLLCALLLSSHALPLAAQVVVPSACVDDQGNALAPGQVNTWIMVLNFNHVPSADYTTGCLIYQMKADAPPSYQLFACPLVNNEKRATVGNGAANFDGRFWIECPTAATPPQLTQFSLQARARFAQPGMYTLLDHPSAAWGATIDIDWRVALQSRYGGSSFQHIDPMTLAYQKDLLLLSEVQKKIGTHAINGRALQPTWSIQAFDFLPKTLRISDQNQIWSLAELIIDPPGVCCTRR
ncbi:MAG: hypothetical protein KF832_31230 [Caldilineaceae bacterium]|nr:hypothetical protein [Caldilineaceae bacterium]